MSIVQYALDYSPRLDDNNKYSAQQKVEHESGLIKIVETFSVMNGTIDPTLHPKQSISFVVDVLAICKCYKGSLNKSEIKPPMKIFDYKA
jgi:hypothetical protein